MRYYNYVLKMRYLARVENLDRKRVFRRCVIYHLAHNLRKMSNFECLYI